MCLRDLRRGKRLETPSQGTLPPFPRGRGQAGLTSFQLVRQQRRTSRDVKPAVSARLRDTAGDGDQGAAQPGRAPIGQHGVLLCDIEVEQVVGEELEQQHGVVCCKPIAGCMANAPGALQLCDERLDSGALASPLARIDPPLLTKTDPPGDDGEGGRSGTLRGWRLRLVSGSAARRAGVGSGRTCGSERGRRRARSSAAGSAAASKGTGAGRRIRRRIARRTG
jgi:hypothetical protein